MKQPMRGQIVTDELKSFIDSSFSRHAVQETGIDGRKDAAVAFISHEGNAVAGAVVVQLFWGQLHIKNVVVAEPHRKRGLARSLMERAHEYGRDQGCNFAFVETMSFQAAGFYETLGYKEEFVRHGYAAGTSFHYMRRDL